MNNLLPINHRLIKRALSQLHVREFKGTLAAPAIIDYFKSAGHSWALSDEIPWCAAFMNWILEQEGVEGTGSLAARSFLGIGEVVDVRFPEYGDIAIYWRVSKESKFGHVGLYLHNTTDKDYIIGGNQSDGVNIMEMDRSRILGYRRLVFPGGQPLIT